MPYPLNPTPKKAFSLLQEGNQRFVQNRAIFRDYKQEIRKTSAIQKPFAAVLSCSDSRTPVELIFDQGLGDIFSIRVAGNVLNSDILGSLEFAMGLKSVKVILVMGHTQCGAVMGACQGTATGHVVPLVKKIQPAIIQEQTVTRNRTHYNREFVNKVGIIHVQRTLSEIPVQSDLIRSLASRNEILLKGAMYHMETGEVVFL